MAEVEQGEKGRKARAFYKLLNHPVYAQVATKSGCTYIKNLFYYLNTGKLHPLGDRIHIRDDQLLRGSDTDIPEIEASPYVFMVVRNPVNRFFSLYFDKIYNLDDPETFWFREEIGEELGMNFAPDLSLEEHRRNLMILINYVDASIKGEPGTRKDPHWARQFGRYSVVKKFDPVLLPLENLSEVLPLFLSDEVPNIEEAMKKVRARNLTAKPYSVNELRNWPLTKRIREVYAKDMKLSAQAQRNFAKLKEGALAE